MDTSLLAKSVLLGSAIALVVNFCLGVSNDIVGLFAIIFVIAAPILISIWNTRYSICCYEFHTSPRNGRIV